MYCSALRRATRRETALELRGQRVLKHPVQCGGPFANTKLRRRLQSIRLHCIVMFTTSQKPIHQQVSNRIVHRPFANRDGCQIASCNDKDEYRPFTFTLTLKQQTPASHLSQTTRITTNPNYNHPDSPSPNSQPPANDINVYTKISPNDTMNAPPHHSLQRAYKLLGLPLNLCKR